MALESSVFKGAVEGIKKILESPFKDENSFSFVYDSPGEINLTTQNGLSIFIYSISPNEYMRNIGPTITSRDGVSVDMRNNAVYMNLYVMITAYSQTKEGEYAILERVIQVLNDQPAIEGAILSPGLVDNDNTRVRIEPIHLSMEELNKMWSIFPQKPYRLSVFYQLTPVQLLSKSSQTFAAVTQTV